jgi:hypothetical protein
MCTLTKACLILGYKVRNKHSIIFLSNFIKIMLSTALPRIPLNIILVTEMCQLIRIRAGGYWAANCGEGRCGRGRMKEETATEEMRVE